MANNFTIVISATDKATAVVRKVNDAVGRLTRPFEQVGKSFKGLGRELGFDKIGDQLQGVGRTAATAARGVSSIVAPMAALTGIGTIGGIVALADGWAKLGRSVTNSAANIGASTAQVQSYEGAAKLAGVATGVMTSSLNNLGNTMEDALFGRNQTALMLFNRLGVGIKKTKDGAVDAVGGFKALAGAISAMKNPQQQQLVAGQFGLTELLPLIRQGPAGLDRLISRAQALGLVMDGPALKSANMFAQSLSELQAAGEGLRNSVGNALIPAIKPLVEQLSAWVSKNRELISSKVGEWAKKFGDWVSAVDWKKVGDDITDLFKGIGTLVDWLGGWKNAAIAVAVVMNGSLIASVLRLGTVIGGTTLSLVGKLVAKMWALRTASAAAAAAQGAATGGSAVAAGVSAGAVVAGVGAVGGALLLSGDTGQTGRDANDLLKRARAGDINSARALARMQLSSFGRTPSNTDIGIRARELSAGGVGGDSSAYNAKRDLAAKSLVGLGWSPSQAAGLAVNFGAESGFNPAAVGDNGAAYGIGQWHKDRQDQFKKWSGKDIHGSSLDDQLRFAHYELTQGNEKGAGARLRGATNAGDAAAIVSRYYERPAAADEAAANRAAAANSMAPAGPYAAGGAEQGGKVHVEVELKNAPPGTKAVAKSSGNTTASTRIGYSTIGQIA